MVRAGLEKVDCVSTDEGHVYWRYRIHLLSNKFGFRRTGWHNEPGYLQRMVVVIGWHGIPVF